MKVDGDHSCQARFSVNNEKHFSLFFTQIYLVECNIWVLEVKVPFIFYIWEWIFNKKKKTKKKTYKPFKVRPNVNYEVVINTLVIITYL